MSRKFFNLFTSDKKQKVLFQDDDTGNKFERRVSVSNSGRWKQKNRQRSKVNEDLFKPNQNQDSSKKLDDKQQLISQESTESNSNSNNKTDAITVPSGSTIETSF